ncbi:MAG: hypothetical protein JW919_05285 [Candidatus Omnitrophica bacterium]|nr:hypothetical protein [Candidatus Omnitrophota bacterium]
MAKSRSLETIERRLETVEEGSIRHKVLQSAKNFKTSWIELGQALYEVSKDKLYKEWGYITFDAYASKEIGIRKETAVKLLKSYFFLEKEEPWYLQKKNADGAEVASVPSYEAVNVLRLAKGSKTVDEDDYKSLRKNVLELGKDAKEVKRDLVTMIKSRQDIEPEEAREKKRSATLRRFVGTLKALKKDIETSKLLPASVLREAESLIRKIESEIG